MTRRETIETLLEHLVDYETTLVRTGSGGNNNGPAMPAMWHHPSVVELYKTLARLHDVDRTAHAHLQAFYRSEWRTVQTRRRTRDKKGRLKHLEGPRQRQRIISPWIIPQAKNRGVTWTIQNFQGEPFLPDELLTQLVA
jgi:hypothetical protein